MDEMARVKLGFAGLFVVEPVGRSGDLALLWKEVEQLEIQKFSRRHIHAVSAYQFMQCILQDDFQSFSQ